MPNRGIAPADLSTPVGKFRQKSNDLIYGPLNPVETGYGDYKYNSDEEIESWLEDGNDSVYMALGFFYLSLASDAAINAKAISDHDLSLDNTKRAAELTAIAERWFRRAEDEEADFFEIAPTAFPAIGTGCRHRTPEGAPCVRCAGVYVF